MGAASLAALALSRRARVRRARTSSTVRAISCNNNTRIVGFNTMFWENYEESEKIYVLKKAKYVCEKIKRIFPDIKISLVGTENPVQPGH